MSSNSNQSAKEAKVQEAYGDLHRFGELGDYEKALKSANQILSLSGDDETALHCKVICLMQLTQFKEALQFIQARNLGDRLIFEKAYSEYRLNKPSEALATIDGLGLRPQELPNNLKELRAQILYRLEQYEECLETYEHIMKSTDDEYEEERRTNLGAVKANLAITSRSRKELQKSKTCSEGVRQKKEEVEEEEDGEANTYEQYFNQACLLCHQQRYAEAERKLRQCEKLCRDFLANEEDDEDVGSEGVDEDIREELAVIDVQIAYCLQMQGKTSQATDIYTQILRNKPKDPILVAVASNNTVVMNKDRHIFDSKKKIRLAMTEVCEQKMTGHQKQSVALNNCLIAYLSNVNYKQLQQLTKDLCAKYPCLSLKALLIEASQLIKAKNFQEALSLLQKSLSANGEEKGHNPQQQKQQQQQQHKSKEYQYSMEELTAIKFAIIQLFLMQNNRAEAIKMLQSLSDAWKYKPGVVSTLVSLYQSMKGTTKEEAATLLKEAVEWYKRHDDSKGNDLSSMFHNAAEFHLREGKMQAASECLEELLKLQPNNMKVLAKLVIAYADYNPKFAQECSSRLPPLQTLTVATEIDALETANWVMATKAKKWSKEDPSPGTPGPGSVGTPATSAAAAQAKKKGRHRKRKGPLPKNYTAGVAPDPERWLPKYERTGFRKKRDRRAKDIIKGSQGMSTHAADQFDMSSRTGTISKNSPAAGAASSTHSDSTPGPRQQHRRPGGHKKKKSNRF